MQVVMYWAVEHSRNCQISWILGYLPNDAYLLEELTELIELREAGGAPSCVVQTTVTQAPDQLPGFG